MRLCNDKLEFLWTLPSLFSSSFHCFLCYTAAICWIKNVMALVGSSEVQSSFGHIMDMSHFIFQLCLFCFSSWLDHLRIYVLCILIRDVPFYVSWSNVSKSGAWFMWLIFDLDLLVHLEFQLVCVTEWGCRKSWTALEWTQMFCRTGGLTLTEAGRTSCLEMAAWYRAILSRRGVDSARLPSGTTHTEMRMLMSVSSAWCAL